jgi:DNA mismatch repair protein MSH6
MGKQTGNADATPARPPPSLKKQSSSTGQATGQRSIHSFFTKSSPANGASTPTPTNGALKANGTGSAANAKAKPKPVASVKKPAFKKSAIRNATPVASSDAVGPSSSQENENGGIPDDVMLSLVSPVKKVMKNEGDDKNMVLLGSSPSRKVCQHSQSLESSSLIRVQQVKKVVSYAESEDDDDDDAFDPCGIKSKPSRARKTKLPDDSDEEDNFVTSNDGPADDDGKVTFLGVTFS